jgi:hypothetical protein
MRDSFWLVVGLVGIGCSSDNELATGLDPDRLPVTNEETGDSDDTDPPDTETPDTDVPPVSTGDTGPGGDTDDPGAPDTGLTDDELCEQAAALSSVLDPYQTAGDGRVTYCHSGGGSNWNRIESDISSCLPHLNHAGDVFPTTGCDS